MKLGILGDVHLRDSSPINRVDKYYEAQFIKLTQAVNIFKKEKVDAILCVGDVFDSYRVSFKLLFDTISFFQKNKLKIYGIWGNHDIIAYNVETLNNSALGILVKLGFYINVNDNKELHIKGIHTRINYDKADYCDSDIVMSHDMVIPMEKAPFDHLWHKELDGCAKVVISGHYHPPHLIQEKETLFINPGALTRMSIADKFHPGVVILDTENLKAKRIELEVEPYEKVFREREESGDVLEIGTVELEKVNRDNVMERIVKYAKDNEYTQEVIDNTVLRVKKAREAIS